MYSIELNSSMKFKISHKTNYNKMRDHKLKVLPFGIDQNELPDQNRANPINRLNYQYSFMTLINCN